MDRERRDELAQFLRSRRERITPAEVGFPEGYRRRTPGLRREEVALLAGVSTTWYTYLEQAREIHPSRQVIDALARVLRLDEDESRYLHRLALVDADAEPAIEADLTPVEIVDRLVGLGEASPYPMYAVNQYCDLLAWNGAVSEYYTNFDDQPVNERNMMRWLIRDPEARIRLPDWENDMREVVARWRQLASRNWDRRMAHLVASFRSASPEFARLWDTHDVREHRTKLRTFEHPRLGTVTLRLIMVTSPEITPCLIINHVSEHLPFAE